MGTSMALTTSANTPSTSKLSSATSMRVRSRLSGVIPSLPGLLCPWLTCCFCIAPPSPFQPRAPSPRVRCRGATILTSRHVSREIALLYTMPYHGKAHCRGHTAHTHFSPHLLLPASVSMYRPMVPKRQSTDTRLEGNQHT